ncbi:MAG: hypothetical protein Q9195_004238 [Heterodermia aff. obscurata]
MGPSSVASVDTDLRAMFQVIAAPDPVLVAAPLDVESNTPKQVAPAPIKPITTDLPKRSLKERDACSPQPSGSGPVPSPDTADAFLADTDLSASGCSAFNIYIERDPSVDPASACPNPPSTTNYKCTLWGAPVAAQEATNSGGYRNDFHIVITGSNAYNKDAPPAAISGFFGPQELGGSIDAPSGYLGYQFFPFSQSQGYDPATCASACTQQTTYNSQHPGSDGSFQTCVSHHTTVVRIMIDVFGMLLIRNAN